MKKGLLPLLIICASLILVARLFQLQIVDEKYKLQAENNAVKIKYEFPERGYIYDRNGKLMVANQPSYDIMVVPREVRGLDTLAFCEALNITREYFDTQLEKAIKYSPWLPSPLLTQLNKREFATFQEQIRRFNGFYIQKRYLREYQTTSAANVFGDIAQVNQVDLDNNNYYRSGDLKGKNAVELAYEDVLRGTKGIKRVQRDKLNRELGPYKDGIYDTLAIRGKDITLTIDMILQEYGESLMVNKRGGIVALDPNTGEILALVSAPSYDPSSLVGRERSKNYTKLLRDTLAKPLFDRGLLAEYVPGSTFKIVTALVGLQEEVVDQKSTFTCNHGFTYGGGRRMKCHDSGNFALHDAIRSSCNTYFANVYRKTIDKYKTGKEGMDVWSNHVKSFGLGEYLGYDLPTGRKGRIPDGDYYDKWYPRGRWGGTTTISNAIGQGEIATTPIQLATMMCAVANRGHYFTPHIIKEIEGEKIDKKFVTRHQTTVHPKYFEPVIEGLHAVYTSGTASRLQIPGINICGKTGTAENFTKINGVRTQLTDHSIFLAFAPMEDPKIVIAVFVENGYWGARFAGPIASLMIEKYLNREITRKDLEKTMYEKGLQREYDKVNSGKPFRINESWY
ncbi:MAG TPA: penicillin-binding protein 2 [Flavobacterium sp.]|nr:penicillin-binding protein 2 [Flavobacterium sp.]